MRINFRKKNGLHQRQKDDCATFIVSMLFFFRGESDRYPLAAFTLILYCFFFFFHFYPAIVLASW